MYPARENKLSLNFISLGSVQAISSLIQLLVIPHVIRAVGVDGFGKISVAQVVMYFFAVIVDYGFNQTAIREVALTREDRNHLSAIFTRVLITRLLLCLFCFALLLALTGIIPFLRENFKLCITAFVFVLGHSMLVNWFFQGLERMHLAALATLVSRLIFAILVFSFIKKSGDEWFFLFFLGTGTLVAGFFSMFIAARSCRLRLMIPSVGDILHELKGGWKITLSHVSNSSCHYANVFILQFFAGDLVVGYYSLAERIFFTVKQAFVIFSQAAYPVICRLLSEGMERTIAFFKKYYAPFLLAVTLGSIALFFFAAPVLRFFAGDQADQSVFYLRVLCIAAVISCLGIPASLILLASNRQKNYLSIFGLATLLNLGLNLILARYFSADGTVITLFITEFFISTGMTSMVYRHKKNLGPAQKKHSGLLESSEITH